MPALLQNRMAEPATTFPRDGQATEVTRQIQGPSLRRSSNFDSPCFQDGQDIITPTARITTIVALAKDCDVPESYCFIREALAGLRLSRKQLLLLLSNGLQGPLIGSANRPAPKDIKITAVNKDLEELTI